MKQILLCALLIAQCAFASDDDQDHISLITEGEATSTETTRAKWCPTWTCPSYSTTTDEDPETTYADLSGEELVEALHERTERSKWCCPLYNTDLTRQLTLDVPSELADDAPFIIKAIAKCYAPMRRKGCGCEHVYCCAGMSEAAGTVGYTTYAVLNPTCGTITGAACCALGSLALLAFAKKQTPMTKNLDTMLAEGDWSEYGAPRAPVMTESSDDE